MDDWEYPSVDLEFVYKRMLGQVRFTDIQLGRRTQNLGRRRFRRYTRLSLNYEDKQHYSFIDRHVRVMCCVLCHTS